LEDFLERAQLPGEPVPIGSRLDRAATQFGIPSALRGRRNTCTSGPPRRSEGRLDMGTATGDDGGPRLNCRLNRGCVWHP
jgi:hypothetical protein